MTCGVIVPVNVELKARDIDPEATLARCQAMLADLQVYDCDPLELPTEKWDGLRPQAVLLGGFQVYGSL